MRTNFPRIFIASVGLACLALSASAEEASERLSTKPMAPATPSRAYVADLAISHIADGRVHIVDAASGNYLGMVTTGYLGQFTVTPDRKQLLVSAGYYSRLDKGERADVLQIYDLATLKLDGEVALSIKRAQALPYRGLLQTSADGKRVYVQNATPATSVTVIDLASRKVQGEIQTPGCWSIYPASKGNSQFSTLCGDGSVLTIVLDEQGAPVSQKRSAKFFDADVDGGALFIHGEAIGSSYYFITFQGVLHQLDLDGAAPVMLGTWPLANATGGKPGWRPGGYAPLAIDGKNGRLYLTMHGKGKEGSHKNPAQEIWAFDLASKKLLRRAPANREVAIAMSRDGAPLLVGVDAEKATLTTYDAQSLKLLRKMTPVGDMPVQVEMQ